MWYLRTIFSAAEFAKAIGASGRLDSLVLIKLPAAAREVAASDGSFVIIKAQLCLLPCSITRDASTSGSSLKL